jgi:hypothetical protein
MLWWGGSVPEQSEQNSLQDSIKKEKKGAWWCVPVIPAMAGSIKQKDHDPGWAG